MSSSFKFCPPSKIAKFQKLPNFFPFHPISTTLAQFLQILPIVKNSQISKVAQFLSIFTQFQHLPSSFKFCPSSKIAKFRICPITLNVAKFQQKFYFKKCPSLGQICISRFNIINFILTFDQAVAFVLGKNIQPSLTFVTKPRVHSRGAPLIG